MEGKPSLCGYYSGFGKPATRTGNPKPCSHEGIPSVELLYLSGCGALSVRLTFINVVEVINVVGYAIVASRQSKSLSRGLCPCPPNRVAHYRYTLKMRLPDTCCLSPLRQVYLIRLSGTDGKRNHTHYRYADPWNGSLLFVATIRDLGSLSLRQATQNPVATKASIPWNCFTFRGVERLASVLRSSTWWRLHSINTCRESRLTTSQRGRTKTHFCASPPCRDQINAEWRALRP